MFFLFSYQTHVVRVFPLNYPVWACFSKFLACFYKITWHHWLNDNVYPLSSCWRITTTLLTA